VAILQYAKGEAERIELTLPEIAVVDYATAALSLEVTAYWSDGTSVVISPWDIDGPNRLATFTPTGSEFVIAGVVTITPNLTAHGEVYRLDEIREYVKTRNP
jgi:hypothetical protein